MPSQPSQAHPVQLKSIFLSHVVGRRNPILDYAAPLVMPQFQVEPKVEDESESTVVITYRIFTAPFESVAETSRNAFYFDVHATAEFALGPSMPKDQLGAFVAAGGLLIVWPYLRQTIADLSQRLGFPPLYLPVLTVPVLPPQPVCPTPVQL